MDRFFEYSEIAKRIAADISGAISPEDKARLEAWLSEREEHREVYRRVAERVAKGEEPKSYRYAPSVEADWQRVRRRISARRWLFHPVARYAAAVAVAVGFGVAAWLIHESKEVAAPVVASVPADSIKPGVTKAVLTLSNGQQMVMEEKTVGTFKSGDVVVDKQADGLSYRKAGKKAGAAEEQLVFNTVTTPRGGEFKLVLEDGTRVWLNAGSELRYPVRFVGKERKVFVKGEVYFEVAKDRKRPFRVQVLDEMTVEVLGTHFNVSAYEEDATIETTLAEGRVKVTDGMKSMELVPNEQAVFGKADGHFERHEVDARSYVAWKDGLFIFEDETLENIMERVKRWYNVDVEFGNEALKELRFSGDLERYKDFSIVLRMLEKVSRIDVEIEGRTVYIK